MKHEIDFLPASYRRRRRRRARVIREAAIVALAVAGMVGWSMVEWSDTSRLRAQAEALETQAQAMRHQEATFHELNDRRKILEQQVRIKRELALPVAPAQIVALLGDALPETVAVRRLSVTANEPKPTTPLQEAQGESGSRSTSSAKGGGRGGADDRPAPEPARVELVGLAPHDREIANLVETLSEHPLCREVKVDFTRRIELGRLYAHEFRLEFQVPLDRMVRPASERPHPTEVTRAD